MFEKPPIWGIIVGLNVCVLIWLITVQEPVMYDASTSLISSGSGNSLQHQAAAVAAAVPPPHLQRFGRDDRDLKEAPPLSPSSSYSDRQQQLEATSTLTAANRTAYESTIKSSSTTTTTTTSGINVAALESHSLTSSLGTGVLEAKQRPTPSWIKTTAVSSALPDEDFNQLIDLHDFHYLVPQPVCSSDVEALILVHSAPRNQEKRQIIRETWASIVHHMLHESDLPLRVIFLLGAVAEEEHMLQQSILQENSEFSDIVQGSFMDDYRNMTYKHIMAFKWFLYNCPEAQILIKVDDDVYVNTAQLIKYLKEEQDEQPQPPLEEEQQQQEPNDDPTIITINDTPKITTTTTTKSTNKSLYNSIKTYANRLTHSSPSLSPSQFSASAELFHGPQNLLFCQKITGSMVKRSYRSKWRVSFKEYSERYYPPYCPGYAIIYSPDVVFRLYTAAQQFKYFWIDDVHITGVLAQQTNTTITTSSHYVLYSDECERLLTGKTDLIDVEFLFAWHSISPQQVKALWHLQMSSTAIQDDLQHYRKRRRGGGGGGGGGGGEQKRQQQEVAHRKRLAYNISNSIATEGFR